MTGERPHHLLIAKQQQRRKISHQQYVTGKYALSGWSQGAQKDQYNHNAKVVRSSCATGAQLSGESVPHTGVYRRGDFESIFSTLLEVTVRYPPWKWFSCHPMLHTMMVPKCPTLSTTRKRAIRWFICYSVLHTMMVPKCRTWSITKKHPEDQVGFCRKYRNGNTAFLDLFHRLIHSRRQHNYTQHEHIGMSLLWT